jgi:peptidoglycan/LPS O-acetylase OafA/YrhL
MAAHSWAHVLAGALMLAYAISGLFLFRFWVKTRDRLFAIFALAFWVLMCERLLLVIINPATEGFPYIYSVRLLAFLLILGAIIDKNRKQAG